MIKTTSLPMESTGSIVRIGMVDSKLVDTKMFEIDINNPLPEIRLMRTGFIRDWLIKYRLGRPPKINLFFEAPKREWLFVRDNQCGEYGYGKRLVLDRQTMLRPQDIISECLNAYVFCCWQWEQWREEKAQNKNKKSAAKWRKSVLRLVK